MGTVAHKIFFTFHFERDSRRVGTARSPHAIKGLGKSPLLNTGAREQIRRQGDRAIHDWIEQHI